MSRAAVIFVLCLSSVVHAAQGVERAERRGLRTIIKGHHDAVFEKTRTAFARYTGFRKPIRVLKGRLCSQRTRLLVGVETGEIARDSHRLQQVEKALEALDSRMFRGARYALAIEHASRGGIEIPNELRDLKPGSHQLPLLHTALRLAQLRSMDRELLSGQVFRAVNYALAALFGLGALSCLQQADLNMVVAIPLVWIAHRFDKAAEEAGEVIREKQRRALADKRSYYRDALDQNKGPFLPVMVEPDTP